VSSDAGIGRYDRRAAGYEAGPLGRWHADIVQRTARLTRTVITDAGAVLDLGCGSGALLRSLVRSAPSTAFFGIDPAPQMLAAAVGHSEGIGAAFALARAEALPCRSAAFDVVVSSVSFGHWANQRMGIAECRRILTDGGSLVLVDVFVRWLNLLSRRGNSRSANTRRRTTRLLHECGFASVEWHDVYGHVIGALVAR
jgi:ubiquinone/menaquinone biosynthesis C-methylase UbiE